MPAIRIVERKLYPNNVQEALLDDYLLQCCRLYNHALEQRIKAYKRRKQNVSLYEQQKWLTKIRLHLNLSAPVVFLRGALHRLDRAYKAFFRRCKSKDKKNGFPRFRARQRYRSLEYLEVRNYFRTNHIFVPGIGKITSRGQDAGERQKLLRIIKRASGWYAQTTIEVPIVPKKEPKTCVGIDVGLTTFAMLSTGDKIDNPRFLRKADRNLRILQRRLARKEKGKNNRRKFVSRVARIHEKVQKQRRSFAHQQARKIVDKYDLIGVENLNIKGLARTRLAKSIHDAAWGFFLFQLASKAESAGKQVVEVNPCGTSQECPRCGAIKRKHLSERSHRCKCGLDCDRDLASALVIEARALAVAGATRLRRGPSLATCFRNSLNGPDEADSSVFATQ